MDRMQFYEVSAIMQNGYMAHMAEYECARLGAYVTACCHSKSKTLKPKDIIEFDWENTDKDTKKKARKAVKETTEEDITECMKRMHQRRKPQNVTDNQHNG